MQWLFSLFWKWNELGSVEFRRRLSVAITPDFSFHRKHVFKNTLDHSFFSAFSYSSITKFSIAIMFNLAIVLFAFSRVSSARSQTTNHGAPRTNQPTNKEWLVL